jgi:trehalose/maltose hydrolase-like predicted phosphorylase
MLKVKVIKGVAGGMYSTHYYPEIRICDGRTVVRSVSTNVRLSHCYDDLIEKLKAEFLPQSDVIIALYERTKDIDWDECQEAFSSYKTRLDHLCKLYKIEHDIANAEATISHETRKLAELKKELEAASAI